MKIFFYHPTSHSDGYPEPPLGLGYLMTVAKKLNYKYEFYDEDHHSKIIDLKSMVLKFNPDLFAISFMTPQYYEVAKKISEFKKWTSQAKIIAGGPHSSALPEETLHELDGIDFLCKGEGEKTFHDFLNYLQGKVHLNQIRGLYYREEGKILANAPRELMDSTDMNSHSVDWEMILKHGPYIQKLVYKQTLEPALPIITTRGCPFECTFCDEGNIWHKKVRMRKIDDVVEEIQFLNKKYNVVHFNILDDTFTISKSRVMEFCNKIEPLNIKFRITAKTTTVNARVLEKLKQAGCRIIAYGVESGDEDVLNIMKKGQTLDDIRMAFKLTREAQIASYALCMVGNIGEDMNAVKKTADLISQINPDLFACSIMIPYPGSENYRICRDNNWIIHYEWEYWVPSVLKTKDFKLVSRTDKMDEKTLKKAYYFMNRYVLINRFKLKYGRMFMFSYLFYINEVFPRMKMIGFMSFFHHSISIFIKNKKVNATGS